MKATLGFYGGVGSVTGANFVLDTGKVAIMVDCGMIQGDRYAQAANAKPFVYNPSHIDILFITHAHADHIGRVPKLVREGFRGTIYSTPATLDLTKLMLADALKVMNMEHERYGTPVLYEQGDIDQALSLWKTLPYHEPHELEDGVRVILSDAGHILGSAMVRLSRGEQSIVFTGDIGNVPQPLLPPPEVPSYYNYMVMESVYGDRVHEQVTERSQLLAAHIKATIARKGTLIIPAFSLERTQGMLFEINNLVEGEEIEPIPVFLDSPLAISVTEVYRRYTDLLKPEIKEQIAGGDDIFSFDGLSFTPSVSDSAAIDHVPGPKIIIAGSGMSHGGRILRHEQRYLGDKNTTVLLVGYQAVGSLGRVLQDGAKKVNVDGQRVKVRAKIAQIRGYSGHADRDQLVEFVAHGGEHAKKIFVTMGEERSSLFLTQRLRDYLGVNAVVPNENQEVQIEF